jgi:hypothetical protein
VRSQARVKWNKLATAKCLSNVKCEAENSRRRKVSDIRSDGLDMLLDTWLRKIMFCRCGSRCFVLLLFSLLVHLFHDHC